jgi:ubiquinone/menaquinone biosynthesis C-methylase UbiE
MVATLDYAKKAFEQLRSKHGCTLLDIGCGDGRDSIYFEEQGVKVTAIDFSEEAISRLKKKAPKINAIVKEIQHMDFPDASFDAIYAHLSLHYFDDSTTDTIFGNIYRMLKPGGLLFVRCKSIHDPFYGKGEKVGDDMFLLKHVRHFFSKEYMQNKLRKFVVLSLDETSSFYDGKDSCFVEAVACKEA